MGLGVLGDETMIKTFPAAKLIGKFELTEKEFVGLSEKQVKEVIEINLKQMKIVIYYHLKIGESNQ